MPRYGCRPQLPTLLVLLKLTFLHGSQGRSTFFPGWLIFAFSFPLRQSWNKFIHPIRKTSKQLSCPRQIRLTAAPWDWNYLLFLFHKRVKPTLMVLYLPFRKPWVEIPVQFRSTACLQTYEPNCFMMVNQVLTCLPFPFLSFFLLSDHSLKLFTLFKLLTISMWGKQAVYIIPWVGRQKKLEIANG